MLVTESVRILTLTLSNAHYRRLLHFSLVKHSLVFFSVWRVQLHIKFGMDDTTQVVDGNLFETEDLDLEIGDAYPKEGVLNQNKTELRSWSKLYLSQVLWTLW